jgi:hypothetical protein
MNISDLSHLEVVESANIEGGWYTSYTSTYNSEIFNVGVTSTNYIQGNTAKAEGTANAYGYNTFTFVGNSTSTTPYSSSSAGVSVSVTG